MASTFRMLLNDRRPTRLPVSETDYCTVVSIFPKNIEETKFTIDPGVFKIPAGTYEKPGLLKVGPSSYWRDIDPEQPLIEVPVPSVVVARSLVTDYNNGMPWFNPDTKPGLFYVQGDFDIKKHKTELDLAQKHQNAWYLVQVKQADMLWARTNGNSLAISDDMRLAAMQLNLVNKDWLSNQQSMDMVRCKACTTIIRAEAIICPNCRIVVDTEKFAKLGMKFAS